MTKDRHTPPAQRVFRVGNEVSEAIWTDKAGVTHQAEGNRMVSHDPGTFIMWTVCCKRDIPASTAFLGSLDAVDCADCLSAARGEK